MTPGITPGHYEASHTPHVETSHAAGADFRHAPAELHHDAMPSSQVPLASHEAGPAALAARAYQVGEDAPREGDAPALRAATPPLVGVDKTAPERTTAQESTTKYGMPNIKENAPPSEEIQAPSPTSEIVAGQAARANESSQEPSEVSTAEQRISDKIGSDEAQTLFLFTEGRADLKTVEHLIDKGIGHESIVNWIDRNVDLPSAATLMDKGADEVSINAWHNRGVDLGELSTYMGQDVPRVQALQLVRAGMDSSQASPLLQEGIAPQTILGMLKGGVSAEEVNSTIRDHVATLMKDGKESFRLTESNAVQALNGPEGTYARVAGPGTAGADVRFIDARTRDVVLAREIKSVGSAVGLETQIRSLPTQLMHEDGVKEVMFQVPRGTPAASWIARFQGNRGANLSQYKGIHIIINDPDGKQLWHGSLG